MNFLKFKLGYSIFNFFENLPIPQKIPVDLNEIFWRTPRLISETIPSPEQISIHLTSVRLKLYLNILKELDSFFSKKKNYKIHHLIIGIQGIGKSFSLWLFAYLLQKSPKKHKREIKVIIIPDCAHLSLLKGDYVVQQFIQQFPEVPGFKEVLITDWPDQKKFIDNFVTDFTADGNILFFMVKQIDRASGQGLYILDDLKGLFWTLVIFTESENNYLTYPKEYICFRRHSLISLVSFPEFVEILSDESQNLGLEQFKKNHDETFWKQITEYTFMNPGEGVKVLKCP